MDHLPASPLSCPGLQLPLCLLVRGDRQAVGMGRGHDALLARCGWGAWDPFMAVPCGPDLVPNKQLKQVRSGNITDAGCHRFSQCPLLCPTLAGP